MSGRAGAAHGPAVLDDDLLTSVTSAAEMSQRLGLQVMTAELVRLKPGRRCLVRYVTEGGPLLGKVRVGHRPRKAFELAEMLQRAGLVAGAPDGVAVAEPVAVFDELAMWVQREVPGRAADELLLVGGAWSPGRLGRRAAEAAVRIHRAAVPARRVHGVAQEMAVLDRRFAALRSDQPHLAERVDRLAMACRRRAAEVAAMDRPAVGIHRDYYPDQLIVAGESVTVIDFDLYCLGDPALDIGNFVGHVVELGVRCHGDAEHWLAEVEACTERFLELAGIDHRAAVRAYTDLTLARHVSLSVELPGRSGITVALLDLCDRRLAEPLASTSDSSRCERR